MSSTAPRTARLPARALPTDSRHFGIRLRDQRIGLPVACVKTVFHLDNLTPVPLAPPEIAGLVNLRGRIVTALHLDRCLGLEQAATAGEGGLAVGIEHNGEEYALLVEGTDDVIATSEAERIDCPAHMDPRFIDLLAGCYRLGDDFLSVLDIGALLRRVVKSSEAAPRDGRRGVSVRGAGV